jgi:hypothetical protein
MLVAMLVVLPESWWELDSDAERTRRCAGVPLSRMEHACVVYLINSPHKKQAQVPIRSCSRLSASVVSVDASAVER